MANKTANHFSARKRLIASAISACFASAPAWANPTAPQLVNGSASFNQAGKVLTVTNSPGTIINWNTFSIGAGETTRFNQASAASGVLNRVLANDPSVLLGTLSSNGKVWLVNPAGIMVGQGAKIDVGGFIASTLNVRNEDFLAGRLNFQATPNAGKVENYGQISAPSGGSVYLIGSAVSNEGIINAPNGEVILAAGQTVQLVDTGTPGVKVAITGAEGNVTNLGQIAAEAGRIGMAGVLVKNNGVLNASSLVKEGGRVFLKASKDAYVDGAGRIVTTGTKGGSIEVLGNRVALMDQAQLDASGEAGGGSVLVGGDYQGRNAEVQNSNITYFGPQASIKADAVTRGEGGKVIVWADDTTRAYGTISARGGQQAGNGGFVEVSGKRHLSYQASTDTRAPQGKTGTLLLDPTNIWIAASLGVATGAGMAGTDASADAVSSGIFAASGAVADSLLTTGALVSALNTSSVVVHTNNGAGAGSGNITVVSPVTWASSTNELKLLAQNNIAVNADMDATSGANLWLIAGWNPASGTTAPTVTPGTGSIAIANGVTAHASNLYARAGGNILSAGSGKLTGYVYLKSGGNISINQDGGVSAETTGSGGSVTIYDAGAVQVLSPGITTVDGNVSLNPTGATVSQIDGAIDIGDGALELHSTAATTYNVATGKSLRAGSVVLDATTTLHGVAELTLKTDALTAPAASLSAAGALSIGPKSGNRSMQIGGSDPGGVLYLSGLSQLSPGNLLRLGSDDPGATGSTVVAGAIAATTNLTIRSGGSGGITVNTSAPISTTSYALNLYADGAVVLNSPVTLGGGAFSVKDATGYGGAASFTAGAAGTITTTGITDSSAGNVTIQTTGPIVTQSITARGGSTACCGGRFGGSVSLQAEDGTITAGPIDSSGSSAANGQSASYAGASAGSVTIQVDTPTAARTINTGTITARGGAGSSPSAGYSGGNGAAGGHVIVSTSTFGGVTTAGIDTSGGAGGAGATGYGGGAGGAAGMISVWSYGAGNNTVIGGNLASAGGAGGAAASATTGSGGAGNYFTVGSLAGAVSMQAFNSSGGQPGGGGGTPGAPGTPGSGSALTGPAGVTIDAGADAIKLYGVTVSNGGGASTGPITLIADKMALDGTVVGGAGTIWLKPKTSGWNIDLGSGTDNVANTLELSPSELNTLSVNGTLRVGALTSGNMHLSAPIAPSGLNVYGGTLSLESGGTVTQAVAGTVSASKLAVKALGDVTLDTAPNGVNYLAAQLGDAANQNRNFRFKSASALTIASGVDGVSGIGSAIDSTGFNPASPNGVIALSAGGLMQEPGALLASKAVQASAGSVMLGNANPTGIISGATTASEFMYRSANGILVTGVNGVDGITAYGNVKLTADTSGINLNRPISTGYGGQVVLDAGAGGFVNNTGSATPLSTSGRWLIYAGSPGSVVKNGMTSSFRHYGAAAANYFSPGEAGNGFIYASLPGALSVNTTLVSGTPNHIYGQAPTAVFGYALSGVFDKEDILGTPVFAPLPSSASNAGAYSVPYASGLTSTSSFSGSAMANPVSYTFAPGTGLPYTVSPLALAAVAALVGTSSKTYDGTTAAALAPGNFLLSGFVGSDTASVTKTSGSYASKNVGTTIQVSTTLASSDYSPASGTLLSNYILPTSASGSIGIITPASLSVSAVVAGNKVYDGGTATTLSGGSLSGVIGSDLVSFGGSASFADKNVGAAKPVNISGLALAGADAGNYRLGSTIATATADITVRPLSTWKGGTSGNWSVAANWDALPDLANVTAVSVPAGTSVIYDAAAGTTKLGSLSISGLSLAGGSLDIANNLLVSSSFAQSAGTLSFGSTANASFTQASGNLAMPAATLANLSLSAPAGAITQSGPIVAAALKTQSQTGATLSDAGNRIGSFTAENTGSGNVSLINTGALSVGSVSNTNGNITIDNTGALITVGAISAPAGAVSVVAHSPLTIGAGGVSAAGNISLSAGDTSAATDQLTLNGAIQSTGSGSAITLLSGDDLLQNANVSTNGGAVNASSQSGGIRMALGASTGTAGGAIGYKASAGSISLASLNAGNGVIDLSAGGNINSVAGFTGANLVGGKAVIVAAGNANFSTQVKQLDVTVDGKFSITDVLTGSVFTDAPASLPTGGTPALDQVLSTITATTQQQSVQTTPQERQSAPPPAVAGPAGGSGPLTLTNTTQTIGGGEGSFGGGSSSGSSGGSGGSSGAGASGGDKAGGDKPAESKPGEDKSSSAKTDDKKDDKKDEKKDDKKKDEEGGQKKSDKPAPKKLATCS